MKVVKAHEMGRIEKMAYAEGALEEQFMDQAGASVASGVQQFLARAHLHPRILLLCGPGNNAGDAYVAGRILREGGFVVKAFALAPHDQCSTLCQKKSAAFSQAGGHIEWIKQGDKIRFENYEMILDGILGTGFHGELSPFLREVIEEANQSKLPIVSIDIPSGVDGNSGAMGEVAIQAAETLFLGLPKSGCFLDNAWNHVGKFSVYGFGLEAKYIEEAEPDFILRDPLLPQIVRNRHKYQAGYVLGLGGSKGMAGAPLLASFAALRAGAGIVRLFHPEGMEAELAAAPFEVISQPFNEASFFQEVERASAVFIGPGIGKERRFVDLLARINKPCVIDADALNLLASHPTPFPEQTILTPHHGEMKRLLGIEKGLSSRELLERTQVYAEEQNVTILLKGAPTFIVHPGEKPHLCARGDPGMATAGSGDVLTGIVVALLAQTKEPLWAANLAAHLHAVAGELAAEELSSYSLVASDIIESLPAAFKYQSRNFVSPSSRSTLGV